MDSTNTWLTTPAVTPQTQSLKLTFLKIKVVNVNSILLSKVMLKRLFHFGKPILPRQSDLH